jgi:hypothetical protein
VYLARWFTTISRIEKTGDIPDTWVNIASPNDTDMQLYFGSFYPVYTRPCQSIVELRNSVTYEPVMRDLRYFEDRYDFPGRDLLRPLGMAGQGGVDGLQVPDAVSKEHIAESMGERVSANSPGFERLSAHDPVRR